MKKYITFILAITLISIFSSCEKVIELNLNTTSTRIIIQGNIYDQAEPYTVKISKSVNFDESNEYPVVSGAVVTIADNQGNSEILTEKSAGSYVTSSTVGKPGNTYTLTVIAEGQTYQASSTMPAAVPINIIYFKMSMFENKLYPTIDFNDPESIDNYYRLIYFINGVQQEDINVLNDEIYKGKTVSYSIVPEDTDNDLKTGDNVTIGLESIDKGVYEYFRTAENQSGSTSPANPTSNIDNGALGYFNACSISEISTIVP